MDQKFILQPFAFAGDVADIPNDVQVDGSVSFNQGFGFDYQRELGVDPLAKPVPRDQTNYLYNVITDNLGQYQRNGIPEFITAADNGGVAYPYDKGIAVKWRATGGDPWGVYVSMVAANGTLPSDATKWQPLLFVESTALQATTGTDGTTIMTPRRVAAAIAASSISIPDASETVKGILEIASTAETNTGTDNTRAITPAKLAAYVPAASTTVIGKTRLATTAEAVAGALATVAVTPAGLAAALSAVTVPDATETVKGIAEIATQAEVTAGADDTRIVTPLKLATAVPAASATVVGKSRFATTVETSALALTTVGVTPGGLAAIMGTKADLAGATFTGAVNGTSWTQSGQFIGSTASNAIFFAAAAGTVILRPNGSGSTSGQFVVTTAVASWNGNALWHAGNFNPALYALLTGAAFTGAVSSTGIISCDTAFESIDDAVVLATTGAGNCYLRPNGRASASGQLSVAANGNVVIAGSTTATGGFQQGSSRRIKNLDGPMPYGLSELLQIETAIGSYKPEYVDDGGRKRLFVIAEQLAEIVAEPVFKDTVRASGDERVPSVDFNQLVPLLIKALQEENAARLVAEDSLRRAVAALTNRVNDLESMR
jgi:hypothetical protein